MEKIITIINNEKSYTPTQISRIIRVMKKFLLSNKNEKLLTNKGDDLIYGQ